MSPEEMARIAREVVSLFGHANLWSRASEAGSTECTDLNKHFSAYAPFQVLRAVGDHAKEQPGRAPKPAEVLARLRAEHGVNRVVDPNSCSHPRPLVIVDERKEGDMPLLPLRESDPVGTRVGCCLHCSTEILFPPGKLLTKTEIEDQQRQRMEASIP